MESRAGCSGRKRCCRCGRRSKILPGEPLHKFDGRYCEKVNGTYQLSSQLGLTDTIYETLDELDEFAMDSGRPRSIQDGENPPFMASSDSLSATASNSQTRSQTSQLLSSQLHDRLQSHFSDQGERRPRLVRMEDVVEKLWDKADEAKEETIVPIEDCMRASFYRPSMIQSTARTDVDLTATWHGDMPTSEMMDPMFDVYNARSRGGSRAGSYVGSLFSLESSLNSQSQCKVDLMSTFGHPLHTGGNEDAFQIFGKGTATPRNEQKQQKPLSSSVLSSGLRRLRLRSQKPAEDASPPKSRSWSWARCVESLRKLKKGLRKSRESKTVPSAESNRPPRPLRQTQRRAKECFSCLGPKALSDISSYDVDFKGRVPLNPVHEAPFLTTSALFDDPTSPPSFSSESLMFYKMSTSNYAKYSPMSKVSTPEPLRRSSREAEDLAELWEDSDAGSSHGSFLMMNNCWVPPVLKTDKEYEASRKCGNKVTREPCEFAACDATLSTSYNKKPPSMERQFSALSSKSSWDIHSVNIDRTHFETTCFGDPIL